MKQRKCEAKGRSERFKVWEGFYLPLLLWRWKPLDKKYGWPLDAENSCEMTANKATGISVLQLYGTTFCQQLEWVWKWVHAQSLHKGRQLCRYLDFSFVRSQVENQLNHTCCARLLTYRAVRQQMGTFVVIWYGSNSKLIQLKCCF